MAKAPPRIRALGVVAIALALGLLAGCRKESRVAAGTREGIVHMAIDAEPSDLDPATNIDGTTEYILNALFEGLVGLDQDGVTIVPGVAERWEISPDGLVYTFHLRPDARWSNGSAVTAEDFRFSFRRIFDPLLAGEESSFGFAIQGAEAYARGAVKDVKTLGLDAPDAHTFVIRLSHPTPYFLSVLASGSPFLPVYRPVVEKFDGIHHRGTAWTRAGNLVSNGPFVLTRWTQNQVIEVHKNPLYWDAARVRLAGIAFYPVESADVQERGFRAGEFHWAMSFPIFKDAEYAREHPESLRTVPSLATHFLTFNVARAPVSDPRVRRALSLAVDRVRLCTAVFHAFAVPAFSQVRPGTGGYTPARSPSYQFDPEEARRLLAAAGYPGGKGFPAIDLMLVGNDPQTVAMGEVVQAAWRDGLGVTANLLPTEKKVYLDAERTHNFQVVIEQWGYPWNDPSGYFQTGQSGNPNNDSGWSDAAFDRAYTLADLSQDPAVRSAAFDRQEAILAQSVPYAPLYFYNKPSLILPVVHGWVSNALGHIEWKQVSLGP